MGGNIGDIGDIDRSKSVVISPCGEIMKCKTDTRLEKKKEEGSKERKRRLGAGGWVIVIAFPPLLRLDMREERSVVWCIAVGWSGERVSR